MVTCRLLSGRWEGSCVGDEVVGVVTRGGVVVAGAGEQGEAGRSVRGEEVGWKRAARVGATRRDPVRVDAAVSPRHLDAGAEVEVVEFREGAESGHGVDVSGQQDGASG